MKTLKLKSPADGLELSVLVREAEGASRCTVQLVHGMCEHKERYLPFMDFLATHGCTCVIHDHRGHGASVRRPEDLGYMYAGGWKAMVEDIRAVAEWTAASYPGQKRNLLGHSMGSMAVRSFVKRHDDMVDCLFVVGSPSDNPAKGAGRFLTGCIALFRGERHRPALLQKLSFGSYNKPFSGEGWSSAWVCSDKSVLEEYHNDPLCQFRFTANGFSNLMGLMQDCYSGRGWTVSNPGMPVHFLSGADDPCMISPGDMDKAVDLIRKVGYTSADLTLYPGMRHEILNESGKESVWNDILNRLAI